jgi:hypothetical protein
LIYKYRDISGIKFGRLTAIRPSGRTKAGAVIWECMCDCGTTKCVASGSLINGYTKSCGCYSREHPSNYKHGGRGKRLYEIWKSMNERCNTKTSSSYVYYGARGIKICDEWKEFPAFREWSLSHGYTDKLTIDRINNDGNYEPINCRWATAKEQARNTSRTRYATIMGVTKPFIEWCELLGLDYKKTYGLVKRESRHA